MDADRDEDAPNSRPKAAKSPQNPFTTLTKYVVVHSLPWYFVLVLGSWECSGRFSLLVVGAWTVGHSLLSTAVGAAQRW